MSAIVIATANAGKLREIKAVLGAFPVDWKAVNAFPGLPEAVEDGDTFADNAAKKAIHYSKLTGLWTLADDSGLEVDVLNGAPGVRSARYAGSPTDDAANNRKLLAALSGVHPSRRVARFRCALAIADGDAIVASSEGAVEGLIVDEPRGTNGFGYDPHFWVPEYDMTTAQMEPAVKNRISHRGRALTAIKPLLALLMELA